MRYEDLRTALPLTPDQVDDLYATYSVQSASPDPERFLAWLRTNHHIDAVAYIDAQSARRVHVSPLATLQMDLRPDTFDLDAPDLPETSIEQLPPPELGDDFEELGPIGQGAMGEVVLVRERTLGRRVALKRLHAQARGHRETVGRFYREAQITAQLEHPGIVPVYGLSAHGGDVSYTMKLVQGRTLQEFLRACQARVDTGQPLDGAFSLPARLRHLLKACDAMAYAHGRGFLHRDLKPANLMIGPFGEVYVMDWGIARAVDAPEEDLDTAEDLAHGDASLFVDHTRLGVILGTPRYMAPEQARGEHANMGPHSDQFALGLVLQELVTLDRARVGTDAHDVLGKAALGERAPMRAYRDHASVPRELQAVVERACAVETAQRYESVAELAQDVERYLAGHAVLTRPDTPLQAIERWIALHRHQALLVGVGLVGLLFAGASLALWRQTQAERASAAREAALMHAQGVVAEGAHDLYDHLLVYEGLVRALATASEQALLHPPPDAALAYTEADFAAGDVPGMRPSERYGRPVNLEWPVFVGADRAPESLARVALLRHPLREAALSSGGPETTLESVAADGVPLVYAFVGFETGVHLGWPGKAGYPEGYDPRARPWYTATVDAHGPHWHAPYTDALGMGTVLPCTMAVRDENDELLGVAGVEMTFERAARDLLQLDLDGVRSTWLLDEHGRVLVSDPPVEPLSAFPYPLAEQSGLSDLGPELLFVFRLGEGFQYAAIVDEASLLGE
jgi:serine/threonine-protein kinase